jgi:mannose/fructose/N-acetylgalactosamine-specific phosphotransferase system component IID
MSLAVIIGVIVIGAYIGRWINRQIEQDEARQRR